MFTVNIIKFSKKFFLNIDKMTKIIESFSFDILYKILIWFIKNFIYTFVINLAEFVATSFL